jgi:hypothetical protein
MRVDVRGYARDCGWTGLTNSDVSGVKLPTRGNWQKALGVKVVRTNSGVKIRRAPVSLTLNGRYIVEVELTKEDIKNLYFEAFSEEPLATAVAR